VGIDVVSVVWRKPLGLLNLNLTVSRGILLVLVVLRMRARVMEVVVRGDVCVLIVTGGVIATC